MNTEQNNGKLTLKDVILYCMVPVLLSLCGIIWSMNNNLSLMRQDIAVLKATVRTEEAAHLEHRELERKITKMQDDLEYVKETLHNHRMRSPYDAVRNGKKKMGEDN